MSDAPVQTPVQTEKYLSYVLCGGEYATRIHCVREIIAYQSVTPLPRLPEHVLGVTNLRGRIIPVVDLRRRLGMEVSEETRSTCIIVTELPVEDDTRVAYVGFVVDQVLEVLEIPADQIDTPPQVVGDRREGILQGLARVGGDERLIGILELRLALSQSQVEELPRSGDGESPA